MNNKVFDTYPEWFHEQRKYNGVPEIFCTPDDETVKKLLEKIKDES